MVRAVRRRIPGTKVGHAGTLDPAAEGLVVVCLGAYTRLAVLFQETLKEYEGVVLFGRSTDTLDLAGRTVLRACVPEDIALRATEALPRFLGGYEQEVPRYSAAKQRGMPFYRLVRKGLETPERRKWVDLHRADVWPNGRSHRRVSFRLVTGSGFYVRAWAKDLGEAVGTPATLGRLIRTGVGSYRAEKAVALDALDECPLEQHVVRDAQAIPWLPVVAVDRSSLERLAHGRPADVSGEWGEGPVAVVDGDARLALIARREGPLLRPWIVLPVVESAP